MGMQAVPYVAVVSAIIGIALPSPPSTVAYHPAGKCDRTYTAKQEFRALRAIFRDPSPVTQAERRKLKQFRDCARSHSIARRSVKKLHWWQRWRVSYRGYWRLSAERLGDVAHGALAPLRGCETRGISFPSNYAYNGSSGYDGAYQYDERTWREALAWRGTPARYYTQLAWAAGVDAQDVVTYKFYYSHRSRWPNCSA